VSEDDRAFEAAMAYDAAFVPRYARPFGEKLVERMDAPTRASVLDVACRTGYSAGRVLEALREGRVFALDPDAKYLDVARARLGTEVGRRVFLKQGTLTAQRFSDEFFTNVVCNLIDRVPGDRGALLVEARRVLRPGGQIAVSLPLRGSFEEPIDLLREVALRYDLPGVGAEVERYARSFASPESARAELERAGFMRVEVESWRFAMSYASGADLFHDPAIQHAAIEDWRRCAASLHDSELVFGRLRLAFDTYFQGRPFEVTVCGAAVTGVKPE
jgi:ubiquinone/menaquinone biosynthesis C-methylase UbiE